MAKPAPAPSRHEASARHEAPSRTTPVIIYVITGAILAFGILMMAFYDRAGVSVTTPAAQRSGVATAP